MSNDFVWMISTVGSCKRVPVPLVDRKKEEGWHPLPHDYLKSDGTPKQMYLPQYDRKKTGETVAVKEYSKLQTTLTGEFL